MLKKLTYLSVIVYLSVLYGQNLFEFGSYFRKEFYFIGMSMANSLIAFTLFKAFKNAATSFYLFMCLGSIINQSFFNGSISYIDISFGAVGVFYILLETKIKHIINKLRND